MRAWVLLLAGCTAAPTSEAPVVSLPSASAATSSEPAVPRAEPPRIVRIAVGASAGCALLTDGTARCWGYRYYPIYGDVIDEEQSRSDGAVEVSHLAGATSIAVSRFYLCAITGGPVLCWGNNGSGQLAQEGTQPHYTPTRVAGIDDATELALAPDAACALRRGGTVWCWGSNFYGELGDGTQTSRTHPAPVAALSQVERIAIGHTHACAVLKDKTVRCWGENRRGQLGDGTMQQRLEPTAVRDLTGVVEVALGDAIEVPVESLFASEHSCARLEDGTVRCWGENRDGQLGTASPQKSALAQAVPDLRGVAQIAAGAGHTCARLADGSVHCWGRNRDGELGDVQARVGPIAVPGVADAIDIASGGFQTCALTRRGEVLCWGAGHKSPERIAGL